MPKKTVKSEALVAKIYPLLVEAVDEGTAWGWHQAHKHQQNPDPSYIKEQVAQAVLSAILDRFNIVPEDIDS